MRVEQREQLIDVRRREQREFRGERRSVVQRADRHVLLLPSAENPNRRRLFGQIHLQHLAVLRVSVDLRDPRLLVHREFLRRERRRRAGKESDQLAAENAAAREELAGTRRAKQAKQFVLSERLPDGEAEEAARELHADVLLLEEEEDGDVAVEEVSEAVDEQCEALRSDGGRVVSRDVGDEKEDELDRRDDSDLRRGVADGQTEEERLDPLHDALFGGGQQQLQRLQEARDDGGGQQALELGLRSELLQQREEKGGERDDAGQSDRVRPVVGESGLATGGRRGRRRRRFEERVETPAQSVRHQHDLVETALQKEERRRGLQLLLQQRFQRGENVELLEEDEVLFGPVVVQKVEQLCEKREPIKRERAGDRPPRCPSSPSSRRCGPTTRSRGAAALAARSAAPDRPSESAPRRAISSTSDTSGSPKRAFPR